MKTVQQIIDLLGGLDALKKQPIRLEVPGFMRLVIEHIGAGPRGLPLLSVAHYYEQNGDLMTDPEMTFEISSVGWHPISFQQANPAIYQEAVWQDQGGKVLMRPKLVRELTQFAGQWDRNLREQGFLDAAKRQASANDKKP